MPAPHPLLKEYLGQLVARGVTHVALTDEVRAMLAGKPDQKRGPGAASPGAPSGRSAATGDAGLPPPSSQSQPPPALSSRTPHTAGRSPVSPAPPAETAPFLAETEARTGGEGGLTRSKRELLDELAREADGGKQARELGTLRETMVFAVGNPDADIMFIGEAPGAEEEKQREPFVGPAGQLLTKIIQAMGLRRSEVYISNVCKFRPKIEDGRPQGSRNRPPTTGEMLACQPYIMAEINIVKPRVLVCLGATASTGLGIEGSVGRLRGRVQEWRGHPLVVTYHPSYLLRREAEDGGGLTEKRLVWEDMMRVMETVGLPISDKQRGYFSRAR